MQNDMKSRHRQPERSGRGGFVFYLSLALLVAIVAYAMIILPQRG